MQEKELTGDALLALDADYVRGATAQVYYAYPSVALPRFLVPRGDTAGLLFAVRMISPTLGTAIGVLRYIPGVLWCVRVLFFQRLVVGS
jgi:hypothetical protein